MSKIVIFGAGGKAGRSAVAEARRRGHEVTAVVRDPAKHNDLAGDGVTVVSGDVLDASSVAETAQGHHAAISAVYDPTADPSEFFVGAANSLLTALPKAGVTRVLVVGLVSNLEVAPGVRMLDTPDFPENFRAFAKGHTAGLDAFRTASTDLDWLVVTPPMVLDEGDRTGTYRVGGDALLAKEDGTSHLSYSDLAIALLDEIDAPKHHGTRISVAD
jgi:putative NADH-flavin reductase